MPAYRTPRLPWKRRQVLGPVLNRSGSEVIKMHADLIVGTAEVPRKAHRIAATRRISPLCHFFDSCNAAIATRLLQWRQYYIALRSCKAPLRPPQLIDTFSSAVC